MISLFELIKQQNATSISDTMSTFIVSASMGQKKLDHSQILMGSKVKESVRSPLIVAKNSQTLFQLSTSIKTLILLSVTQENILWEDENIAEISDFNIITVCDGHELIRRFGYKLCLANVNLRGAQLPGARLYGANLNNADLRGCNLERANMRECSLIEASLEGADLSYANLYGANLELADVRRANLKYADARQTNWDRTALRGAELWGAYFWKVNLVNAFTNGVDMERVDTRGN
ncbi:Pentapeptide repeat-containing protein [Thermoactinomyces sp. DSM 45891]|nr:Pentapeptide repeat-containing protein [Thermoactinomyces sp. DSM 45891]